MPQVRVHNLAVSLDGFGTGEGQSLDAPFGHAVTRLLELAFDTQTFHEMHGRPGGGSGVDEAVASTWGQRIGAEIMGRNKFGPQRGPWVEEVWKGWWGENPPSTHRCSCSRITRGARSRWTAEPPSTS